MFDSPLLLFFIDKAQCKDQHQKEKAKIL